MEFWNRRVKPALDHLRAPHRVARVAAIAGGFVLGMFYTAARFFDPAIHTFIAWAKEWQTLLAGAAALLAALLAAKPVYQQLAEARRQSAVMTIPIYKTRIGEIIEQIRHVERLRINVRHHVEGIDKCVSSDKPDDLLSLFRQEIDWRGVDGFYSAELLNFADENPGDELCPGGIASIVAEVRAIRQLAEDLEVTVFKSNLERRITADPTFARNHAEVGEIRRRANALLLKIDIYFSNLNVGYEAQWRSVREAERRARG